MAGNSVSSAHPLIPPTTEEDRFTWLRLLRSRRVGIATFWRLLSEHGTAAAALDALPEIAAAAGVEDYSVCPPRVVEAELNAGRRAGARLLARGAPGWPAMLEDLPDTPPLLWIKGGASLLERPAGAMVGARNASSLGTRMARRLAADLGKEGQVIVSGLARGIDAAAHHGALETGTIAVLAGGVDVLYPAENTQLGEAIATTGLLVSEQPIGLVPQARHFPARNRIIAGLSQAVVVVEAAAKSGSLITVRDALDLGRDVLAVPGHPFDARAAGCNHLIRDGARLVRSAADVLEGLPTADQPAPDHPPEAPARPRSLRETAELHSQILARLGPSPLAEDQLIRDLAAPTAQVAPALLDLELDGRIRRQAGGLLSLVQ